MLLVCFRLVFLVKTCFVTEVVKTSFAGIVKTNCFACVFFLFLVKKSAKFFERFFFSVYISTDKMPDIHFSVLSLHCILF